MPVWMAKTGTNRCNVFCGRRFKSGATGGYCEFMPDTPEIVFKKDMKKMGYKRHSWLVLNLKYESAFNDSFMNAEYSTLIYFSFYKCPV